MQEVAEIRVPSDASCAPGGQLSFAEFELDLDKAELRRAGSVVPVSALSLSLLAYLVRHRERVLGRDELLAEVWRGVAVGEGSLRQAIWELRQALGDAVEGQRLIGTVRGRGYRFLGTLREPHALAKTPGARAAAGPKTCFGRVQELALLQRMLEQAAQGMGSSCVIVGPPGIGKSRLARELVYMASARALVCAEGHCDPDGFAPAFWPWLQLLKHYIGRADAEARARYHELSPAAFRLLAGAKAEPLVGPAPLDAAPARERFELLEELGRLFAELAAEHPGLLLLEDLQWADESSLALLGHVVRLLPRSASLLVVTCRDLPARENRALARALESVQRSAVGERIALGNLSLPEVTCMIDAHMHGEAPRALCADVHALSRGNPLLALELTRLLARRESDREAQLGTEQLEVKALIRERLLGLPGSAQPALLAASVLTPEFGLAELAGVLAEPPQQTLARLDVCVEHGVIGAAGAATRFQFAHPLMREVAHGSLSHAERARLHRLAGEWIERHGARSGTPRLSELAQHFFAAAPGDCARKAIDYALRCAELSYASMAYADALNHYDRALSCVDLDPDIGATERLEIELLRGEALRASGADATRVNQHFLALGERAEALGDAPLFARAVLGYSGHQGTRFTPTRFLLAADPKETDLLERALAGLGERASELRVLLLCALTYALFSSADRARRERLADEALSLARSLSNPSVLARALFTRVYCCAAPDSHARRLAALDELVELTQRHQLKAQEIDARVTRAVGLLSIGEASLAKRDSSRAATLARELSLPRMTARSEVPSLLQAFWQADLERAERLARRALDAASQDLVERALFLVRMASLSMLKEGLRKETLGAFETVCALYPDVIGLRCLLASLYAQCGVPETAARLFDELAQDDFKALPEDLNWLSEMVQLAGAAIFLEDPQRAARVYARLLPYGQVFDFFGSEACPAGPIAFWLGELAVTAGDYTAAEQWFDAADELNRRLEATLFMQYTAIGRAKLLLLHRPQESARAHGLLRGVVAFARRTGADWLRLTAETIAQELGRTRPEPAPAPATRLRALP
jgi:eukaryotic-like serine/threonine-protein kinase